MPWNVFSEALKTRPAGCGAMFTTKEPRPFQASIAFMTRRYDDTPIHLIAAPPERTTSRLSRELDKKETPGKANPRVGTFV
jgi:hypothetical protein